ncbi:hypothetical protein GCM10027562_44170 [Arthrobacter pigmenti]
MLEGCSPERPGRPLEDIGNGVRRWMAATPRAGNCCGGQNPAYRPTHPCQTAGRTLVNGRSRQIITVADLLHLRTCYAGVFCAMMPTWKKVLNTDKRKRT